MNRSFFSLLFLLISGLAFGQEKTSVLNLYFEFGKDQLIPQSTADLKAFLEKAHQQSFEITITTFCDTIGSNDYNIALSDLRLARMKEAFSKENITLKNFESRGEVLSSEAASNPLNHQRRAQISYTEPEKPVVKKNNGATEKFASVLTSTNNSEIEPIRLDIQFEGGTAIILSKSFPEMESLFAFMDENKQVKALIRGHVCCQNDPNLATQRAFTVYQGLLDRGIAPERIDFKGFSNTLPVVFPEVTEEDRQRNRRVDVVFEIKK